MKAGGCTGRILAGAVAAALVPVLAARPASRLEAQSLTTHRLTVASQAAVDSVRRLGIDVVEVNLVDTRAIELVMVLSPHDEALLRSRGYQPVAVARPSLLAAQEERRRVLGAAAFSVYRDFDDPARGVRAYVSQFAASRANVVVDSIGASVQGRPILAVKIGPPGDSPSRPNVLFMATYHAREWAATEVALRLMRWLADSLPLDPVHGALAATRDVWVIPVVNPDGYQYTFSSQRLWRRNRRSNADGSFGVDLNRNHAAWFAFDDLGSSGSTSSALYRGPFAESEPEVRAVVAFHAAHPPVASISYHSYAGAVLYAWSHSDGVLAGDDPVLRALAGTALNPAVLDSVTGSRIGSYHPGPGWHLYPTNGDYVSWAHRAYGTAAFTVEVTSGCCIAGQAYGFEFPDDEAMLERVFRDNLPFALSLIMHAGDLHRTGELAGMRPGGDVIFESVWPEVRVLVPSGRGAPVVETVEAGTVRRLPLAPDSLGSGRFFTRFRSGSRATAGAAAVRAGTSVAEFLMRDGAESADAGWHGDWRRLSGGAREGEFFWSPDPIAALDGSASMLASPPIAVAGRGGLVLSFWTRHSGSLFDQGRRGRVEYSVDGGPWIVAHEVAGAVAVWVPVRVELPAPPADTLRIRFVAYRLQWSVDAIAVTSGTSVLFAGGTNQAQAALEVNANPVRAVPLVVRWEVAPSIGAARVEVHSMLGTRLRRQDLTVDPGVWHWDLTTDSGQPVANGAYFVVVVRGDGLRMRRRVFVAR